jgi:hypothetical protein
MRIDDIIYFSPSLKLEDLRLDNKDLVSYYFNERIEEYYFKPIRILVENKMAFSAGALECLLIDAFARYSTTEEKVGKRFSDWCIINLKITDEASWKFYDFFRCGLLHESHIKQFGQFCFDEGYIQQPLISVQDFIVVNPKYLLEVLESYLASFIKELTSNDELYDVFIGHMVKDFGEEVSAAKQNI